MLSATRIARMQGPLRQRGFSLIELLVTVVIFSVGLLSIAGLQAVAKSANFESVQRSTASNVAFGLLEDMRMNSGALANYAAVADFGEGTLGAEPNPNCRTIAAACTPVQRATHDLWFWETIIDGAQESLNGLDTGGLVSPTVCVGGPAGGIGGTYQVAIAWRGSVAMSNPQVNACGQGSGKYGAGDEFRRVLVVDTFIAPNL